jgi:hypothetical protein
MLNNHKLRAEYKKERKLLGINNRDETTMDYIASELAEKRRRMAFLAILIAGAVISIILLLTICRMAADVNMAIVSQIESNNNANAFNSGSGAIGLCQVTPILLKEYNQIWGENFRRHELFNPQVNMQIAEWYMNQRIPYLLKHFNQPDTLENRLLAYNAGIRAVIKHRMPKESHNYIIKYKRLAKG